MSATAADAVVAQAWRRFAQRPQCPTYPTRRGFEERPRADSRRPSSSRGYEWPRSYLGGLDGSELIAASTDVGAAQPGHSADEADHGCDSNGTAHKTLHSMRLRVIKSTTLLVHSVAAHVFLVTDLR